MEDDKEVEGVGMVIKTSCTDVDTMLSEASPTLEHPKYTETEDDGYRSSVERTSNRNNSSSPTTPSKDDKSNNRINITSTRERLKEGATSNKSDADGGSDGVCSRRECDKPHDVCDTSTCADVDEAVDRRTEVGRDDSDDDSGGDIDPSATLPSKMHWGEGAKRDEEEEEDMSSRWEEFADAGPSADRHPLPRCSSGSLSTSMSSPQRVKERNGGAVGKLGLFLRRCRTMSEYQTTVSSLLGANGSGATTVSIDSAAYRVNTRYSSIGGHHMAIQCDGVFMKESCSRREELFYEMVKPVQAYLQRHLELLPVLYATATDDDDDNEEEDKEATEDDSNFDRDNSGPVLGSTARLQQWQRGAVRGSDSACVGCSSSDSCTVPKPSDNDAADEVALRAVRHWSILLKLAPFFPRYIGVFSVRVASGAQGNKNRMCSDKGAMPVSGSTDALPDSGSSGGNVGDEDDEGCVRQMIVLEDLCSGFTHPCILDIKMGTRQYGLNPSEKKRSSKERKAALSTSMQYGVRLAGMKRWCPDTQQYETQSKIAGLHLTLDGLRDITMRFMQRSRRLQHGFRNQLRILHRTFLEQHVFRFFTSSLLFVYDADRPLLSMRVVMVDFAFTYEREELRSGGDPDAELECDFGYIKALDTMISILS